MMKKSHFSHHIEIAEKPYILLIISR